MYIGVDVGTTKITLGFVSENGEASFPSNLPMNRAQTTDSLILDLIYMIKTIAETVPLALYNFKLMGIGIGVPGLIDKNSGTLISSPNIGWKNVQLKETLERHFTVPVVVENDSAATALAELELGALQGTKNSVFINLGAGIGAGVIIDGKLYRGNKGRTTELGHTIIGENFYDCNCGKNGCLETFISTTALVNYTKKLIEEGNTTSILDQAKGDISKLDAKTVMEGAKNGDATALMAFERFIKYLGIGISNVVNTFDPELIAIGGELSQYGDFIINRLKEKIQFDNNLSNVKDTRIVKAKLVNHAGLIGAGLLCKYFAE
jgi:glucokinase